MFEKVNQNRVRSSKRAAWGYSRDGPCGLPLISTVYYHKVKRFESQHNLKYLGARKKGLKRVTKIG